MGTRKHQEIYDIEILDDGKIGLTVDYVKSTIVRNPKALEVLSNKQPGDYLYVEYENEGSLYLGKIVKINDVPVDTTWTELVNSGVLGNLLSFGLGMAILLIIVTLMIKYLT